MILATLGSILFTFRLNVFADDMFYTESETLAQTITERLNRFTDLLYSARAYVYGSQKVTQNEWQQYFKQQQVIERYQGVSAIYYVDVFNYSEQPAKIAELSSSDYLNKPIAIRPMGQRTHYALASLVFSANDVTSTYGTDLLSLPGRAEALTRASETQRPIATRPDKLASGYYGFSISLPVSQAGKHDDYIGISFRAEQLLDSLYGDNQQLKLKVEDITGSPVVLGSRNWNNVDLKAESTINVGGRAWKISQGKTMVRELRVIALLVPLLMYGLAILGIALVIKDKGHRRPRRTKLRKFREK